MTADGDSEKLAAYVKKVGEPTGFAIFFFLAQISLTLVPERGLVVGMKASEILDEHPKQLDYRSISQPQLPKIDAAPGRCRTYTHPARPLPHTRQSRTRKIP
jgi:hypothetical protein